MKIAPDDGKCNSALFGVFLEMALWTFTFGQQPV